MIVIDMLVIKDENVDVVQFLHFILNKNSYDNNHDYSCYFYYYCCYCCYYLLFILMIAMLISMINIMVIVEMDV